MKIVSIYNQEISPKILSILQINDLINLDYEVCFKKIDNFFTHQQLDEHIYILSTRLKMQKIAFEGSAMSIIHCSFYGLIIKMNAIFERLENYCADKYGAFILSTLTNGIGSADYDQNNLFAVSDVERLEKEMLADMIEKNGYNADQHYNILKFISAKYSQIMTEFEINSLSALTNGFASITKKLILIGNASEKELLDNFLGKSIELWDISDFMSGRAGRPNDGNTCIIILHPTVSGVLEKLWIMNFCIEKEVLMPKAKVFSVNGFIGKYEDFWGNKIQCNTTNIRFDLSGYGANISVTGNINGFISVNCATLTNIQLDNNVSAASTSIGCLYGSKLHIGDNSRMHDNIIIRMGPFTTFNMDSDCILESDTYVLAGDGHSIFDINTGERTNYLPSMLSSGNKLNVIIGKHVLIRQGCVIISGCNVGHDSIIEAKSIINKKVDHNTYAGGNPLKVIKENINWNIRQDKINHEM